MELHLEEGVKVGKEEDVEGDDGLLSTDGGRWFSTSVTSQRTVHLIGTVN